MIAALLLGAAWAGPVGLPVPDPEASWLTISAVATLDAQPLQDAACTGEACQAVERSTGTAVAVELSPLRYFGLHASLGRRVETVASAFYEGTGLALSVGLRGALPLSHGWGLAGDLSLLSRGTRSISTTSGAYAQGRQAQATLLGTWGRPLDGLTVWAGPQTSLLRRQIIAPLGDDTDGQPALGVSLQPRRPLSGLVGGAFTSDPLGLPWRRSARVTVGLEIWAGQGNGADAWLGLGW